MLLCDVGDAGSLATMARQTRLVLNCVGPVSAGMRAGRCPHGLLLRGRASAAGGGAACARPGHGERPRTDSAALGTRPRSSKSSCLRSGRRVSQHHRRWCASRTGLRTEIQRGWFSVFHRLPKILMVKFGPAFWVGPKCQWC